MQKKIENHNRRNIFLINYAMEENLFVNVEYSPVKHQLHGFLSEKNVTKKTKLFHTDEKVFVFMLRTSDLKLVSSRRLDSGTNI